MTVLVIKVELEAKMVHLYNLRFLHNSIQGLMTHYFLKIYFQFAFVFTKKKKKQQQNIWIIIYLLSVWLLFIFASKHSKIRHKHSSISGSKFKTL